MSLDSFKDILNKRWSKTISKKDKLIHGRVLQANKHFLTIDIGWKESIQLPISTVEKNLRQIDTDNVVLLRHEEFYEFDKKKPLNLYTLLPPRKFIKLDEIFQIVLKNKNYVNGLILNEVKGGYSVGLGGIVAFLPKSQISLPSSILLPQGQNKKQLLNKIKTFSILNIDEKNKNIVLSRLKAIQSHQKYKNKIKKSNKE